MKKSFFYLAASALALSACSTEEVLTQSSVQTNAIGFENVIKKSTRADDTLDPVSGDLTLKDFNRFCVFGYYTKSDLLDHPIQIFAGDVVSKVETSDKKMVWTYDDTRYWVPGAMYQFYAYSCADVPLLQDKGEASMVLTGSSMDDRALQIIGYVCDTDHQHDLITAVSENIPGVTTGNSAVKFAFNHALSKVSAEFVNDFPAGYNVYVSNVRLVNFYDKGNCNLRKEIEENGEMRKKFNVWSGQSRAADSKTIAMPIAGSNKATSTVEFGKDAADKVLVNSVFMIPMEYNNANVSIEFTISVTQSAIRDGKPVEDEFLNRTIKGTWKPTWEAGKAYNYIVHISGNTAKLEPIVFEASHSIESLDNWTGEINADMNFDM